MTAETVVTADSGWCLRVRSHQPRYSVLGPLLGRLLGRLAFLSLPLPLPPPLLLLPLLLLLLPLTPTARNSNLDPLLCGDGEKGGEGAAASERGGRAAPLTPHAPRE